MNIKAKRKEVPSVRYFNMENVSLTGFCNFCKKNTPLLIAVTIALFFAYGIRLFWYSIGTDTELFMADKSGSLKWSMSLGRFGYVLLSKLVFIKEFNPFTAFFTAFCLIWFFTISWCYIIAIFNRDTGRNNKLIPFALVFMTMPVWAEQFYFLLQAAENAFIISLCPYVVYLLYKGFLDHEKGKIACASILLVFMISVYQAIVPLFCCGVFVCFVLLQEHSDYEPRVYRNLCLKLFITLIGSLAVYFIIARVIIPEIFHIEQSDYPNNMNKWGQVSFRRNIFRILAFGYTVTIGHISLVQDIANSIMANHAQRGMETAEFITERTRILGNILLLPGTVLFLFQIIAVRCKTIPTDRRLLYMLAGIGIPLCIMLFAVAGGTVPPPRTLYALPLALSFMLFYLIKSYRKKAAVIVACLALFSAVYQAQVTAQLFYSDQMRYNEDVHFAIELDKLITQAQPDGQTLPVALIGRRNKLASQLNPNFFQGNAIGRSSFESGGFNYRMNLHALSFMNTLGIYFDMPDINQFEQALEEAASMPPYPDPGCVKCMQDIIVVRISETLDY